MPQACAVDLGATSVRVAIIDLAATEPHVEVVHRWRHGPVEHDDGTLRWDWPGIVEAVDTGLERALDSGPIASIGVDTWGVDYGLVDVDGRLLDLPFSYRDDRTEGWEAVADRIGRRRLYDRTGIQLMPINTIFQLAVHDQTQLQAADRILLLPDLLIHHLTGHVGAEASNASTTALVDHRTQDWDDDLLAEVGVRRDQLPAIESAGRQVGTWRGVPVLTVGSHDTASAFIGAPGLPGPATAIVASGTWVLVGAEREDADVSDAARLANFSNEGGAAGGVRFLKNVMGFWILERCRDAWGRPQIEEIVAAAAAVTHEVPVVDLTGDRFLSPDGIEDVYRADAGLEDAPREVVARSVIESIVAGSVTAIHELGAVIGIPCEDILHIGGGTRIDLFNELLAGRTGVPVRIGSPEAAALGNALVQAVALGVFDDLASARRWAGAGALQIEGPR